MVFQGKKSKGAQKKAQKGKNQTNKEHQKDPIDPSENKKSNTIAQRMINTHKRVFVFNYYILSSSSSADSPQLGPQTTLLLFPVVSAPLPLDPSRASNLVHRTPAAKLFARFFKCTLSLSKKSLLRMSEIVKSSLSPSIVHHLITSTFSPRSVTSSLISLFTSLLNPSNNHTSSSVICSRQQGFTNLGVWKEVTFIWITGKSVLLGKIETSG